MDATRRRFLQIAGLSVLGLGAKPVADAIASAETPKFEKNAKALVANDGPWW